MTTVDSFVLRFIIRPFAHLVTQRRQGTRLLPALIAKQHAEADVQIGTSNAERSKLSDITYIGHDEQGDVLMTGVTAYNTRPVHRLQLELVLRQKQRLWQHAGLLTHSDTHYIAYRILQGPHARRHGGGDYRPAFSHYPRGRVARDELLSRPDPQETLRRNQP
jgi:hypothetical protein